MELVDKLAFCVCLALVNLITSLSCSQSNEQPPAIMNGTEPTSAKFSLQPADISAAPGAVVILGCQGSGHVTWYKDGRPIRPFPFNGAAQIVANLRKYRNLVPPSGAISFPRLVPLQEANHGYKQTASFVGFQATTVNDAGSLVMLDFNKNMTGFYVCVLRNSSSKSEAYSVPAEVSLSWIGDKFRVEPPTFVGAKLGQTIAISCSPPNGSPTPVIRWKKAGIFLRSDERISIDDSGNLLIQQIQVSDYSAYQCVAENGAGTLESTTRLLSINYFDDLLDDCKSMLQQAVPKNKDSLNLDPWLVAVLLCTGSFALGLVVFVTIILFASGYFAFKRRKIYGASRNFNSQWLPKPVIVSTKECQLEQQSCPLFKNA